MANNEQNDSDYASVGGASGTSGRELRDNMQHNTRDRMREAPRESAPLPEARQSAGRTHEPSRPYGIMREAPHEAGTTREAPREYNAVDRGAVGRSSEEYIPEVVYDPSGRMAIRESTTPGYPTVMRDPNANIAAHSGSEVAGIGTLSRGRVSHSGRDAAAHELNPAPIRDYSAAPYGGGSNPTLDIGIWPERFVSANNVPDLAFNSEEGRMRSILGAADSVTLTNSSGYVRTGRGADTLTVHTTEQRADGYDHSVRASTGDGDDRVAFNLRRPTSAVVTLGDGADSATVNIHELASSSRITLDGGFGNDSFDVWFDRDTHNSTVVINGGDGTDRVNISRPTEFEVRHDANGRYYLSDARGNQVILEGVERISYDYSVLGQETGLQRASVSLGELNADESLRNLRTAIDEAEYNRGR